MSTVEVEVMRGTSQFGQKGWLIKRPEHKDTFYKRKEHAMNVARGEMKFRSKDDEGTLYRLIIYGMKGEIQKTHEYKNGQGRENQLTIEELEKRKDQE